MKNVLFGIKHILGYILVYCSFIEVNLSCNIFEIFHL